MCTKSSQSLYRLIFMFTMLAFLTSCGEEKSQVGIVSQIDIIETVIPGVYFEIPEGALPASLDLADIKIEPTSPPADLIKSGNDIDIQAWKLTPEGTRFKKPVRLVAPFKDVLPSFLHLYNGERSWVADVIYKITPQGHTASVSLEHFSDLVIIGGSWWRQAFEFSAAMPDTQVGELVDAKLTVSMTDYNVFTRAEDAGFQVYLVQGSKKVCGSSYYSPCLVYSNSENLVLKDSDAARDASNIQADILPFEEQFTLSFSGFRCTDVGPAVISFSFTVEWEGRWERQFSESGYEGIPTPHAASLVVDVPFNCFERSAVTLFELEQRVQVSAYSREAASNKETNETRDEQFHWSAFEGGPGSYVDNFSHEGVDRETRYPWESENGDMPSFGNRTVPSESQVTIPVGLEALARLNTNTRSHGAGLTVDGDLYLHVKGMGDIDRKKWAVLGSSSAELTMAVAIRAPSIVTVTNCVLFDQSTFQQFTDYQYHDKSCTFKVDGDSTLELPSVGELPGSSLPRVTGLLGGQIITFNLNAYGSTEEPLHEIFGVSISTDKPVAHGIKGDGSKNINDGASRDLFLGPLPVPYPNFSTERDTPGIKKVKLF